MNDDTLGRTRRSLHGIAELVLAGPQHRASGRIRLRVTPGGFGGVTTDLRVEGTDLVGPAGRVPLAGTYREVATAAGVDVGAPQDVYSDTTGIDPDEPIDLDPAAVALVTGWFALGDAALRAFAADVGGDAEPVLWPEHFDLAIAVDEVNYGASAGDAGEPRPYAYVGPWTPREGEFWNAPFGALRPAEDFPDVDTLTAFFAEGRRSAAQP
ncbi:hypothetical protein [Pseudonocardia humida]|uniref:hypothetical protein n=1 Tax=Pseudonocardia humida TaxID=2800819 RepID=UPI00207C3926|nr:hypothetical protein [Pseudonocardia humida]